MSVKICAFQSATLPMSDSRVDYYLKIAKDSGANLIVFGEYVLNSFFSELKTMPKIMIYEQSQDKIKTLTKMASKYDMTIVAPIVLVKGIALKQSALKAHKMIAKFTPTGVKYKAANALMPYSHWDESSFFERDEKIDIMSFSFGGVKFACIFGFEAHFDKFWEQIREKNIDCVLIPSASALDSKGRWSELLRMRAWLNNVYVLRVNRLGKAKFGDVVSEFYGNSMLISPYGEILNEFDDKEGMLLCEIDKKQIKKAKALWKFRQMAGELEAK